MLFPVYPLRGRSSLALLKGNVPLTFKDSKGPLFGLAVSNLCFCH